MYICIPICQLGDDWNSVLHPEQILNVHVCQLGGDWNNVLQSKQYEFYVHQYVKATFSFHKLIPKMLK